MRVSSESLRKSHRQYRHCLRTVETPCIRRERTQIESLAFIGCGIADATNREQHDSTTTFSNPISHQRVFFRERLSGRTTENEKENKNGSKNKPLYIGIVGYLLNLFFFSKQYDSFIYFAYHPCYYCCY